MEQSLDLSPLEGQSVDPETFRRVWQRVMPDQSGSPIVVKSNPGKGRNQTPFRPSASRPPVERPNPPRPPEPAGEEETLRRLMDLAHDGVAAGTLLARRGRNLNGLSESCRRGLRRLAAAHFLLTGRRYTPKSGSHTQSHALNLALRERFLWEQQWVRACLQGAEGTNDPALGELYRDLAQDGEARQRLIRRTLEQM